MIKITRKELDDIIAEVLIEILPPMPLTIVTATGKKYKIDAKALIKNKNDE